MTTPVSPVSAEELLPCPFCGSDAKLCDLAGWEIHCQCGAEMVLPLPDKEPLIAAWNRRSPAASGAVSTGEVINHEEALQLAHLRKHESNLARCYIDLATAASGATPEGYALVPVEPTHVMLNHGRHAHWQANGKPCAIADAYRAMIAAAPLTPDPAKEEA